MDGLTLCKVVKKELPDIKIVILSGYDDFNYAKEAIGIGVEDYLLKPITKNAFLERLCEIRSRYEHEKSQREYYEQFHREMQEYEQNSSRDFFEGLISGNMDMGEMYERADKLGLDIVAEAYNILIFTLESENAAARQSETYSEWEVRAWEKIEGLFADHSYAMLFRNNVFSYGRSCERAERQSGQKHPGLRGEYPGDTGGRACGTALVYRRGGTCDAPEQYENTAITRRPRPTPEDTCMTDISCITEI